MISGIVRFVRTNYLLIIILLAAAFLRFYGIKWDSGFPTHPDERDIVIAVSRIRFFSNLDPRFFTYGGFPIYLISLVAQIAHWGENLYRIHLISRALSALASTGSVLLIFLVAKQLFNKQAAFISLLLAAFTPGLIQYAHFGVGDSLAIFLMLVTFYLSLQLVERPTFVRSLMVGSALGLAIGTKIQSVIFVLIPTLALISHYKNTILSKVFFKNITAVIFSAFFWFLITNPFLFSERKLFFEEFGLASAIARGKLLTHFTLQFIGVSPFTFNINNIFWLVGPILIFGFLFFVWLFFSKIKEENKLLIFVLFPVVYFLYVNTWHAKFIRYMLPVIPFVLIAASAMLIEIRRRNKTIGNILLFSALFATIFYGLAFFSLYRSPMTTVSASDWIFKNIPAGSKILTEALDLKLPLSIPGKSAEAYRVLELPMYQRDSSDKVKMLTSNLASADYLVLASPRFWKNIPKDPQDYPISTKYYEAIFDGSLGYTKMAEFNKYPSFLGISIKDDVSEETFKVFEHPRVLIFRNEKRLPLKSITNILQGVAK